MWWRLRRWRRLIEKRAARCERLGIAFVQAVAPEKLTILSHYCAEPLIDPSLSPAMRLAALMARSPAASRYVDLEPPCLQKAFAKCTLSVDKRRLALRRRGPPEHSHLRARRTISHPGSERSL
jgi:hypothetical protein